MKTVLIVDDEQHVRAFLREVLEEDGYEVCEAAGVSDARTAIREYGPTLVVLDLMLPDGSGIDVLKFSASLRTPPTVIVITALGTIQTAVSSIKQGAFDFITKPFDVETIRIAVDRAIEYTAITQENIALRQQRKNAAYFNEFIGECAEIKRIKDVVLRLNYPDVPILITGETGTGKNVLAKEIHYTWSSSDAPLVSANCASIPEHLFESELFGHERGSFTGATSTKKGLAEEANGGTLILDEVAEMPQSLQAKLLHLIQDRTFQRVGSTKTIQSTARIIALTNRDLEKECAAGRFRCDLYYRLNVVHFRIPPLRARPGDALLLADRFITQLRERYDQPEKQIAPECLRFIQEHQWPGNVRELKNQLERAFIFSDDQLIRVTDLGNHVSDYTGDTESLREKVARHERKIIREMIALQHGNKTAAAAKLRISVRNLHYKLSNGEE